MKIIDTLNTRRTQFDRTAESNVKFAEAIDAVEALIAENEMLRRAIRKPTTETFAKDVAAYEAELCKGCAA